MKKSTNEFSALEAKVERCKQAADRATRELAQREERWLVEFRDAPNPFVAADEYCSQVRRRVRAKAYAEKAAAVQAFSEASAQLAKAKKNKKQPTKELSS
jgi:hypothetical protein